MANCIYCHSESAQSREHVLSQWTGCRVALTEGVCINCNNSFGNGPEARLSEMLALFADVAGVEHGAEARRKRIWTAQVGGEKRSMQVDQERSHAQPASPVVTRTSEEHGGIGIRILATEQQFGKIDSNLKRKHKHIIFTRVKQPGTGQIDVSCDIDFSRLNEGDSLVAIAKYAANYALYSIGRTNLTLRLADQAKAALDGRIDPTSFAGFMADPAILNRMSPSQPHHTVMLAPIDGDGLSRRRWAVVVILFGILPYYVVSPEIDVVLHLSNAAHRFYVNENERRPDETSILGAWPRKPAFPASTFAENKRSRRNREEFVAANALRMLGHLAQTRGWSELRFERG